VSLGGRTIQGSWVAPDIWNEGVPITLQVECPDDVEMARKLYRVGERTIEMHAVDPATGRILGEPRRPVR